MRAIILGLIGIALASCAGKETASGIPSACMETTRFLAQLEALYDEKTVWAGYGSNGAFYAMSDSGKDGTWTFHMASPQGVSCAIMSGTRAHLVEPEVRERLGLNP